MTGPIDVNGLIASLPANVREAIQALVAQELAKNAPPPPKEFTPREQIQQHLSLARASLQHAGNPVFYQDRVLSALEQIADIVFPEQPPAALEPAPAPTEPSTTISGGAS